MYKSFLSIWFQYYKSKTGSNYLMDGQQGKHLKLLIKKIEAKVNERGMESTEENMVNSFSGFLQTIKDPWILDHLEISLINSKFNSLYVSAIKNSPLGVEQAILEAVRKYRSGGASD